MTRDRGNVQYTLRSHILVLSSSVVTQINLFCLSTIIIYHLSGRGPRGKSYVLYIYICRPYTEICSMSGCGLSGRLEAALTAVRKYPLHLCGR